MAKVAKKMILAVATTALGAALVGGASFALFTSSTTNSGNTFTAGTVVVTDTTGHTLTSEDVLTGNLAPGDHNTFTMTVKNNGTLDEWVQVDAAKSAATNAGSIFGGATPLKLSYAPDVVKLAPGESHTFNVDYNFPLAADNSYQSATGSFNVVVDAVQARNNTNGAGTGPQSWN
jgi:spore coat-associated protein N